MQKGFFKRYCKTVYKGIVKYTKNYLRDIIEEINVGSFTKYKYNFLCEFIGSFAFVFFISIYMLQSNSSEEYIITRSKQINPYGNNELFLNTDTIFENESINFLNNSETYERSFPMDQKIFQQKINDLIQPTEEEVIEDLKGIEFVETTDHTTAQEDVDIIDNDVMKNNLEPAFKEENIHVVLTELEQLPTDSIQKEQPNTNGYNNKRNGTDDILVEPLVKEVDKVIFKDDINEYSKIKISDIDQIDLENIDKYEKLSNVKNIVNSHHSIYTILGCLIYVIFVILGAHINPAYTYALWFLEPKKYGFLLSTFYVCFQYLGGILASILVAYMYGSIFIYSLLPKKRVMKIFVCETLCTFILTMILISLYHYKRNFIKESKKEESDPLHFKQIKNLASASSLYDDFGSYEHMHNSSGNKRFVKLCIENRHVKYIMNHIFYLIFIFSTLLFFIFVTNTTLNPMFMTSTLHTYLYFKLFRTSGITNVYSILRSFFSIQKIFQMIVMYIYSLPFWIGPYVGSAFASIVILFLKEEESEEDINVLDTKVYKTNKKKEKLPLLSSMNLKQNAYLVEYNSNMHQNIHTFMAPAVY